MVRQGKRQVGSTIKPFVYTFAFDQLEGLTPCTTVENWPVTIETYSGDAWSPVEAGGVTPYDGVPHELRWGMANSRNNYSAWIMKQARQPQAVANFIHQMGIRSMIDPVPALCLGTPDVSLYEMVGAYGTFANRGVRTEPIFVTRIEDRQGNVLETFTPQTSEPISEQTAYTMLDMLKHVVDAGTAARLRGTYNMVSGKVGGKTGTSQNSSDAWFMGVTPHLVAGAWVGAEDRSVHLYSGADGARQALPIFGGFMTKVYADPGLGITPTDDFLPPVGSVVYYNCNSGTGASAEPLLERDDDGFE
jgi:penicillin-binding protein 1A